MKFALILPSEWRVDIVEAATPQDVYARAGLDPARIDHGTVATGIAIVVYEFGLFEPIDKARYFSIGRQLYVGNAVLYGFNAYGETVDLPQFPSPWFYRDAAAVEAAIAAGNIDRPVIRHDGEIVWQWPKPKPDLIALSRTLAAGLDKTKG